MMAVNQGQTTGFPISASFMRLYDVNDIKRFDKKGTDNKWQYQTWHDHADNIMAGTVFPVIYSVKDAIDFLDHFHITLNVNNTYLYSKLTEVEDVGSEIREIQVDQTDASRSSIVSRYLMRILAPAAPLAHGLFFQSDYFWYACCEEILKPDYDDIMLKVESDKEKTMCSKASLIMYEQRSKQFRMRIEGVLAAMEVQGIQERISTEDIEVDRNCLNGLLEILQSMLRKRAERLYGDDKDQARAMNIRNTQERRAEQKKIKKQNHHVHEYVPYFKGAVKNPPNPVEKASKSGFRLISTAILEYCRSFTPPKEHIEFTNNLKGLTADERTEIQDDFVKIAQRQDREAQITEANRREMQYAQQCANMDVLFNFFIWLRSCGMIYKDMTVDQFDDMRMSLNVTLHSIGRKISGKEAISKKIKTNDITETLTRILRNAKGTLTMPPYVLTYRRIYDMVAIAGIVNLANLRYSLDKPGVSTRYMVSFKENSEKVMKQIIHHFKLEEIAEDKKKEKGLDLFESEHTIHQMLMRKMNPYRSTIGMQGDVFAVRFVASRQQI